MKGIKPSAGLVYAFSDKVGWERQVIVDELAIFKRIMQLGVGHSAGVKPNVNEVGLALHGFARWRNQDDWIYFMFV